MKIKTTFDRFTLAELKKLGFDFTEYQRIGDDHTLTDFDYFHVCYKPVQQLITINGIAHESPHEVLYFADSLDNYHIICNE